MLHETSNPAIIPSPITAICKPSKTSAKSSPTAHSTAQPTAQPTAHSTAQPTVQPTAQPTVQPTAQPTVTAPQLKKRRSLAVAPRPDSPQLSPASIALPLPAPRVAKEPVAVRPLLNVSPATSPVKLPAPPAAPSVKLPTPAASPVKPPAPMATSPMKPQAPAAASVKLPAPTATSPVKLTAPADRSQRARTEPQRMPQHATRPETEEIVSPSETPFAEVTTQSFSQQAEQPKTQRNRRKPGRLSLAPPAGAEARPAGAEARPAGTEARPAASDAPVSTPAEMPRPAGNGIPLPAPPKQKPTFVFNEMITSIPPPPKEKPKLVNVVALPVPPPPMEKQEAPYFLHGSITNRKTEKVDMKDTNSQSSEENDEEENIIGGKCIKMLINRTYRLPSQISNTESEFQESQMIDFKGNNSIVSLQQVTRRNRRVIQAKRDKPW